MRTRVYFPWTAVVAAAFGAVMAASSYAAGEEALRSEMLRLAGDDADERASAIRALAMTGDPRLEGFFETYRTGGLFLWEGSPVRGGAVDMDEDFEEIISLFDALSGEALLGDDGDPLRVPVDQVAPIEANRNERRLARAATFQLGLSSPDASTRLAAVKRLGDPPREADNVDPLMRIAEEDPVKSVRQTALESALLIRLTDPAMDAESRVGAAERLGGLRSNRALGILREALEAGSLTGGESEVYQAAVSRIESYRVWVRLFDIVKQGLSTGSILVLMALGLAITFGMMGIINMAHGEMMTIGAYTTFCMQILFGHSSHESNNLFFLAALPASFAIAGLVGGLIEYGIVRHLYRRPLESLLATFGVSLVLIQAVRLIFGDNQASNSPTWLVGSLEVAPDMSIPYARIFILCLTVCCVAGVALLMKVTMLGLRMRAVMQNRPMAKAMGIPTRAIDLLTFMMGSGIAGVAGCALTTIGGITPDMGQNYIIDSFLVVVAGGVGKLLGVVCSGLGLGVFGQVLEGNGMSPVWSKISILAALVVFIQFRPAGLFPHKGRLTDD